MIARNHTESNFHNKDQFDIYIYSLNSKGDELTEELKKDINVFREISDISDDLKGKIIVCGSYINYGIYKRASDIGVKVIVMGIFIRCKVFFRIILIFFFESIRFSLIRK